MPTARDHALSLLSNTRASGRFADHKQLQLAEHVSLLGTLRDSLSEASRQGDTRSVAKLAPLIASRTDRVAAILDASRGTDCAGMSDEQ